MERKDGSRRTAGGWHGWRDDLYRRIVEKLAHECASRMLEDRAMGRLYGTRLVLDCELEVHGGLVCVRWESGQEPRADAWGREEYLPRLSTWLSERLARHGTTRITDEAERMVYASDCEDEAYRLTEEMLLDSRIYR